jgi:hypothetical protein
MTDDLKVLLAALSFLYVLGKGPVVRSLCCSTIRLLSALDVSWMGWIAAPEKFGEGVYGQWMAKVIMKVEWTHNLNSKLVCILTTTFLGHSEMKGCLAVIVKHDATMDRWDYISQTPIVSEYP